MSDHGRYIHPGDLRPERAPSEYESLREDIGLVAASLASYSRAVSTHADAVDATVADVWSDIAALRDELHAVANRLENLTRAITTEPAEVAQMVVNNEQMRRKAEERWSK
jgi:ABC-type transporter Mla subunit MlaD